MQETLKYMKKLEQKYNVDSAAEELDYENLTIQDLPNLVEHLQVVVKKSIEKVEQEIEGYSKLVQMKDKELISLRASSMAAPDNKIVSVGGDSNLVFSTPVKAGKTSNLEEKSFLTPVSTTKSDRSNAVKVIMQNASPTIKESARLNAEVLQEVLQIIIGFQIPIIFDCSFCSEEKVVDIAGTAL